MFKKIKNIIYLISFFAFIVLTTTFYLSDQNITKTNKSRTLYSLNYKVNLEDLPLLKNDTNNIIQYRNDIELYKKNKKKYTFWDLIKSKN